ncbi:MAG: SDR family oxidoreductase [Kordiimonadaceae bacterium]|nr:SDR family oxidoreductase [Kordiimonadaceae bacterium]
MENNIKNVYITGGAGYIGAILVPKLLDEDYHVTVIDLMIYGKDVLQPHPNLKIIEGDIRDQDLLKSSMPGHQAVIHLACISNDPSFELNPKLGKSINLDAFRPLVEISRDNGVMRLIYASTGAVYGVKNEPQVHEDMQLEPLTDYARFKADCENILFEYQSKNFTTVAIRSATVCGYSPRQRLDVVVNILTNLAYHKREITVFGGEQLRPNIHIDDVSRLYSMLLKAPKEKIAGEVFNICNENHTVKDLANIIKTIIGDDVNLVTSPTDDIRSYHLSSKKIETNLGFKCEKTIDDAVSDLRDAFRQDKLPDSLNSDLYFNVKRMQNISLV